MTNNDSTAQNPVGRFMVAVGAVIENNEGQILLLLRDHHLDWHAGEWEIPYGRLDQFEDPKDGLIREIGEEVGLVVQVKNPLSVWHIYRGAEESAYNELIGITFLCGLESGQVKLSDEHAEYRWIDPEGALELVNVEGIRKDIKKYRDFRAQKGSI